MQICSIWLLEQSNPLIDKYMATKLFYSIGETAEILGENVSLVRYWCNTFSRHLQPHRTAKGNRQFREEDIETLKQIHYLVKVKGLTLDGVEKQLSEDRKSVGSNVKALETLKEIRSRLVQIRKDL